MLSFYDHGSAPEDSTSVRGYYYKLFGTNGVACDIRVDEKGYSGGEIWDARDRNYRNVVVVRSQPSVKCLPNELTKVLDDLGYRKFRNIELKAG